MTQSGHSLAFPPQRQPGNAGQWTRQRKLSALKLLCLGVSLLVLGGGWAQAQDNSAGAKASASSAMNPQTPAHIDATGTEKETQNPDNASKASGPPVASPATQPESTGSQAPSHRVTVASEAAQSLHVASVPQDLRSPSIALGGLFAAIGGAHLAPDFKNVADSRPDEAPADLLNDWETQRHHPDFNLRDFYQQHFSPPIRRDVSYRRKADENIYDYIQGMWGVLTRQPDKPMSYSSLLPLPHPYVVPGGRFSELYYWDTYFTMIGLYETGQWDLLRGMIGDMASLIDRYDHIPNGTRTYYLSRSEPPFFSLMVDLLAQHDGQGAYKRYLPQLQKEYAYWMEGADTLKPGQAYRHVVRLNDGTLLLRHWDDLDTPRDESYPEDVATAARAPSRAPADVYRDLRAGSETGWDFSSRWLADGHTLATIHTTDLAPIEVNALMVHLEQTLEHAYALTGQRKLARLYGQRADERVAVMRRVFWDDDRQAFYDYDWRKGRLTDVLSAATAMPLFLRIASQDQAMAVAETIRDKLLRPGGIMATDHESGQQWDAPNGWAPEEWMAIKGLNNYGDTELAETIARRWMARVIGTYEKSGVLLEKYDVESPTISATGGKGGGEYPMQIGFGWTNGTLLGLMRRYPGDTSKILQRNPLSSQPPIDVLPPSDPYSAVGPEANDPVMAPAKPAGDVETGAQEKTAHASTINSDAQQVAPKAASTDGTTADPATKPGEAPDGPAGSGAGNGASGVEPTPLDQRVPTRKMTAYQPS
ncbi:alpha,alpha-trehalase TreF [Asaia bogorensis]|uniref:alpha,alpha-trehalase TreF n=1 Tax=Asaia bogorensis TaxID=91915 RepID=UPI002856E358|nr:alpha,alpha-trehalase TreF [Asaia bogorensis]MDR6183513.1 alpha,alpha-trehalase [Asaia bogorensis NBRC 16594]